MFTVIQADPAWDFDNKKTGGSMTSGASQKYPTMPLPQIMQLPVPSVLSHTAVCFLWVPTALKFSHGGPTLNAWGFTYKTTIYWDKQRMGMGAWFRNWVEELLVGVRGDPEPFGCQLPNIIHTPALEHSEKPGEFTRLIEAATGTATRRRYLELFARKDRPGWRCIGNQVTGNEVRTDLRNIVVTQRCTWVPEPSPGGGVQCKCTGQLQDHHPSVVDAVTSGLDALALRIIGDQAAGR